MSKKTQSFLVLKILLPTEALKMEKGSLYHYILCYPKSLTRASTLHVNTLLSARHSTHLTLAVCAKKTVLHTRSQCVHPTLPHLKTSVSLNWKCAGGRETILCIILEVALVRLKLYLFVHFLLIEYKSL